MSVEFIHLHNHFLGSFSDSTLNIDETIKKLKRFKQKGIAITDHADLSYIITFLQSCEKKKIKPIIGMEVYFVEDAVYNIENNINSRYHLVIFAKNYEGLVNLIKINNKSYEKNLLNNKVALVDWKLLEKFNEGLILSSACFFGIVPQYLLRFGMEKAESTAIKFKNIFNDDYYFELGRHFIEDEDKANEGLIKLSKKLDIKCIVTNDVHYLNLKNWIDRDLIIKTRFNKVTDFSTDAKEYYLKSTEQMLKLEFDNEYYNNTMEIYDKCNVSLKDIDKLFNNIKSENNIKNKIVSYLTTNNYFLKEKDNTIEITSNGKKAVYKYLKENIIKYINFNKVKTIEEENFEKYKDDLIKVNHDIIKKGFENIYENIKEIPRCINYDLNKILFYDNEELLLPIRKTYFVKYLQFMNPDEKYLNKLNILEIITNNDKRFIETFCQLCKLDPNKINEISDELSIQHFTEYVCAKIINNEQITTDKETIERIENDKFIELMKYSFNDYNNYMKGISHFESKEYEESNKYLEKVKSDKVSENYYYIYGQLKYYLKDYTNSIKYFKKYLAENYLNYKIRSTVYSFIGWAYNWLDEKNEAYNTFITSLKLNRYNELSLYGKGIIEYLMNDFNKAEKTFKNFLVFFPTSKRAVKINKLLKSMK